MTFEDDKEEAAYALTENVMEFDSDNDSKVTREEFKNGVSGYTDHKYVVKQSLCGQAKQATRACKEEFKTNGPIFGLKRRVLEASCWSGLAGFADYEVEQCILASAGSCPSIAKCITGDDDEDDDDETEVGLVKRDYYRRDSLSGGSKFLFWSSMIVLGVMSWVTVIGIPFYLIVLIVSIRFVQ